MTGAKKSDLLQKVKSVVPKLISGMHKVRDDLQALSDCFQRVRSTPEGEECCPQAHQRYAQGKGSSASTFWSLTKSQTCSRRWRVSSPSSPAVCTRSGMICKHSLTASKESDLLQKVKSVVPKLTSGMHKVRDHLQALSACYQGVRLVPEGEECHPQDHQQYAQGKGSSASTLRTLQRSQIRFRRWRVPSPSWPGVHTR